MSDGDAPRDLIERPEPVPVPRPGAAAHLEANRTLIIKRSLLATAVAGAVPFPVMDDYLAARVVTGMLMKIAARRQVDLPQHSAELLADPREGTAARNVTMTAATILAFKYAWRKVFAVLAIGRRAEDMATTFQTGTLFDHYCAKLHVGGGIDRPHAFELRQAIHAAIAHAEKAAVVGGFREGSRVLSESVSEAPAWVAARVGKLAERWTSTGGNPAVSIDPAAEAELAGDSRWLDRATQAVERRLSGVGESYLTSLVSDFEKRWHAGLADLAARAAEAAAASATKAAGAKP